MLPPVRTMLVALAGVALLVPAIGAAAVQEDPPVTTPVETIPLPPDPTPPVEPMVTLEAPPAITITIEVPALPEPAVAAPNREVVRPRAPARRVAPTRVERVGEPETQRRADVAPMATRKPTPKATPQKKLKQKELKQPKRKVIAPVSAPQGPIRDHMSAHSVLAGQFSSQDAALPATTHRAVLYLVLVPAVVLGMLFGLVGAAPVLAVRWPQFFDPVIDASEWIVFAGVCLAGAVLTVVLTLAITWALTGPSA